MIKLVLIQAIQIILLMNLEGVKGGPFFWKDDPKQVQAGQIIQFGKGGAGIFEAANTGARVLQKTFTFPVAFDTVPVVAIANERSRFQPSMDLEFAVRILSQTTTSFTYQMQKYNLGFYYSLKISWMASTDPNIEINQFEYFFTAGTDLNTGTGYREVIKTIPFASRKTYIPKVYTFLTMFTAKATSLNQRVGFSSSAVDISFDNFQLVLSTNLDTTVQRLGGFWVMIVDNAVYQESGIIKQVYSTALTLYQFVFSTVVETNSTLLPTFRGHNALDWESWYGALDPQTDIKLDSLVTNVLKFEVGTESGNIRLLSFNWIIIKYKTCPTGQYLYMDWLCVTDCINGTYIDTVTKTCKNCHSTCVECSGPNIDNCLSCLAPTRVLDYTTKVCLCSDGYFQDGLLRQICSPCAYQCLTCTQTQNQCITCRGNRESPPSCYCPDAFWQQGASEYCQECYHSCDLCSGGKPTQCQHCKPTYNFTTTNSTCDCPIGFYDYQRNSTCLGCDATCLTCSGPQTNQCLSCNTTKNRLLFAGQCQCRAGFVPITNGDCTPIVKPNCLEFCTQCDENDQCVECESPRVLSFKQCVCPDGMYNNFLSVCRPCDDTCKTCLGPSQSECVTCRENFVLNIAYQCNAKDNNDDFTNIQIALFIVMIVVVGLAIFLIPLLWNRESAFMLWEKGQTQKVDGLEAAYQPEQAQLQRVQRNTYAEEEADPASENKNTSDQNDEQEHAKNPSPDGADTSPNKTVNSTSQNSLNTHFDTQEPFQKPKKKVEKSFFLEPINTKEKLHQSNITPGGEKIAPNSNNNGNSDIMNQTSYSSGDQSNKATDRALMGGSRQKKKRDLFDDQDDTNTRPGQLKVIEKPKQDQPPEIQKLSLFDQDNDPNIINFN